MVVSLAAVSAVAAIGGAMTETGPGSWYERLDQPAHNPPDWVFGPVWTVLYVAMAVAAWLIWRDTDRPTERRRALGWYGVQLGLNLGWTLLFFGLELPGWALAEIAALAASIVVVMVAFHRLQRVAAWMLAPYLAWVLFAASINLGVVLLN